MKGIDNVLAWYQGKIGAYDKQSWEISVEQRILQGLENRPKKDVILKPELIDVDLVRGSAFSKTKPQHGWSLVLMRGLTYIVFMPFCYSYWSQHTSAIIAKYILFHYLLQVIQMVLFLYGDQVKEVSVEEILVPMLLSLALGILHAQIISPHGGKKKKQSQQSADSSKAQTPPSKRKSNKRRSKRKVRLDTNITTGTETVEETGLETGLETGMDTEGMASSTKTDTLENHEGEEVPPEDPERFKKFIDAKNKKIPDPVPYPVEAGAVSPQIGDGMRRRHRSYRGGSCSYAPGSEIPLRDSPSRSLSGVRWKTTRSQSTSVENGNAAAANNEELERLINIQRMSRSIQENRTSSASPTLNGETPKFSSQLSREGKMVQNLGARYKIDSGNQSHGHSADNSTESEDETNEPPVFEDSSNHKSAANDTSANQNSMESPTTNGKQEVIKDGVTSYISDPTDEITLSLSLPPATSRHPRRRRRKSATDNHHISPTSEIAPIYNVTSLSNRSFDVRQVAKADDECYDYDYTGTDKINFTEEDLTNEELKSLEKQMGEISNEDTFTTNTRKRVIFERLFRLRSANSRRSLPPSPLTATSPANISPTHVGDPSSSEELQTQPSGPSGGVPSGGGSTARGGSNNSGNAGSQSGGQTGSTQSPLLQSGKVVDEEESSNETDAVTTDANMAKSQASETELDRMNSDVGSNYDSTSAAEEESAEVPSTATGTAEDPFVLWYRETHHGTPHQSHASTTEAVSCYVWEGEQLKKADLTLLDIGWSIIQAVERYPLDTEYSRLGFITAFFLSLMPLFFRAYTNWTRLQQIPSTLLETPITHSITVDMPVLLTTSLLGSTWRSMAIVLLGILMRFGLYVIAVFLLCVAERTFEQRLQYVKHFCYLTSSRRARKYYLPHFRLNKVRNIKFWLSLRSYLKKRGPQRSVESIITAAFYLVLTLMSLLCAHMLSEPKRVMCDLMSWDLIVCSLGLGIFLLRFLTLGTKITKKYRNLSVLITEQINLYLAMEKKPHKKEELMLANNVLKLAENLLKELDGPFRVCGWSINPLVYNILKVVILSGCSAVLSKYIGFKLKLYKIKINPINW